MISVDEISGIYLQLIDICDRQIAMLMDGDFHLLGDINCEEVKLIDLLAESVKNFDGDKAILQIIHEQFHAKLLEKQALLEKRMFIHNKILSVMQDAVKAVNDDASLIINEEI